MLGGITDSRTDRGQWTRVAHGSILCDPTRPDPTHGSTQHMDNSAVDPARCRCWNAGIHGRTAGRTDGRSWIISVGRRGTDDTHRTNLYTARRGPDYHTLLLTGGRLGSRLVSVLDSGAEGPGFKSQPRRCRVTVVGKLFTPIVPLFTKQPN